MPRPHRRQRYVPRLSCVCKRTRKDDDGRPMAPDYVTCGCGFTWCQRCHPAPGARCWNEIHHREEK